MPSKKVNTVWYKFKRKCATVAKQHITRIIIVLLFCIHIHCTNNYSSSYVFFSKNFVREYQDKQEQEEEEEEEDEMKEEEWHYVR